MNSSPIDIQSIMVTAQNLRNDFDFVQTAELLNEAAASCGDHDWREKLTIADCFKSIHRVDRSIQIINQILESVLDSDAQALIRCHLAIYLEMVGEFSQAEEEINRSIDVHPDAIEPQIVLARILGHLDEHERTLWLLQHVLAKYQPKDAKSVIRIFYQMSQSSDSLGMYDDAFEWALKAKAIQRKVPGVEELARNGLKLLSGLLQTAKSALSSDNKLGTEICRLDHHVPMKPVHLIGFPRSGTTLLGQMLETHPDIHLSSELPIFTEKIMSKLMPGDMDAAVGFADLSKMRDTYFQHHLRAASDTTARILIDKKPANLPYVDTILKFLPTSQFLVALRDPRDVVASCFLRFFPLTDMSANFLSLGTGSVYYATYMQIWRTLKPLLTENNCLPIRYEQLCHSPDRTIDDALDFLNCDSAVRERRNESAGKYIHSPTFADVRKPIGQNRCGRWKHYQKHFKPVLRILDPVAHELGY